MKKLLKILMCISLVAALALSMVACGDDAEKAKTEEPAATEEPAKDAPAKEPEKKISGAEATVDSFLSAFFKFDFDKAGEYLVDASELPETDLSEFVDEISSEMDLPGYEEESEQFVQDLIDLLSGCFEYEIDKVEEDGDNHKVTVTITTIDEESMENVDFDTIGEEIAMDLLAKGDISEDMSEDELMDAMITKMLPKVIDALEDVIKNADKKEMTATFIVVEDGGKYLIETIEGM